MRIEVLVDVKTTLGEGPLWDVDEQRLYWIDSFDGMGRATEDRFDGLAQERRRGGLAAAGLALPGLQDR
jgi:sugar lactone lactonase YvrE